MYLTGRYWDKMHMTFEAHVDGLYAAAKRSKLESAREWFKAALRYHKEGREEAAMWAAVRGAEEVSQHGNANAVGFVGLDGTGYNPPEAIGLVKE